MASGQFKASVNVDGMNTFSVPTRVAGQVFHSFTVTLPLNDRRNCLFPGSDG